MAITRCSAKGKVYHCVHQQEGIHAGTVATVEVIKAQLYPKPPDTIL